VELDAGEAIVFAGGTHVELNDQHSLTASACALLEKKGKYKPPDFTDRGAEQSALGRLLANRNAVMAGKEAMADKRAGQQQLL
jgi:hypothetical protein